MTIPQAANGGHALPNFLAAIKRALPPSQPPPRAPDPERHKPKPKPTPKPSPPAARSADVPRRDWRPHAAAGALESPLAAALAPVAERLEAERKADLWRRLAPLRAAAAALPPEQPAARAPAPFEARPRPVAVSTPAPAAVDTGVHVYNPLTGVWTSFASEAEAAAAAVPKPKPAPAPAPAVAPPSFGTELRRWRLQRGLSQAQVGRMVGVTPAAVSYWEREVNGMETGTAARLLRIMGATPARQAATG